MKTRLKKFYFRWLHNRYAFFTALFIIWLVFFDTNNIIDRHISKKKIDRMEEEINYYKQRILTDSINLEELQTNNKILEKFAREKYFMKRNNEDIFIINR